MKNTLYFFSMVQEFDLNVVERRKRGTRFGASKQRNRQISKISQNASKILAKL